MQKTILTSAAPGINKTINFQGKMTEDQGLNVADGTYQFVFSLYTVASGGSATWTETVNLSVQDGIFQHNLGSSTALPGAVDFDTDNIFLGITFNSDPDGEMTPRIQLTATPYAFNADMLDGLDASDFIQLSPSVAQTGDIAITGDISAGSLTLSDGSSNTGTIAVGPLAGDYTYTIPSTTGNDTFCLEGLANCSGLSATLADNTTNAWDIQEGTNNYININTTDSSENISFGNATTNPSYNFLGSGSLTVAGASSLGGGTSAVQLVVRGHSAQGSTNLMQWRNSSDVLLSAITNNGSLLTPAIGNTAGDGPYIQFGTTEQQARPRTASQIGFIVKGQASQSADLLQVRTSTDSILFNVKANGDTAIAGTLSVSSTSTLTGLATFNGGLRISDGSGNWGTLAVQSTSGDYTYTIPTTTANDTFCLEGLGNCGVAGGLVQVPADSATNTVSPTANSVVALTLNRTTGTATNVLRVNTATTPDAAAQVLIATGGATQHGLVIQRAVSQTANIFEIQNEGGTPLIYASASGNFTTEGEFISPYGFRSADTTGASGGFTVRTGNTTGGSGLSTGNLTLRTGNGTGTNTSSGNVVIDSGTKSGTGTTGYISLGATSASAIMLARTGVNVSVDGNLRLSDGSSNYATIAVDSLAGDYSVAIPTITGNDTFCLETLANCGAGNAVQLQGSTPGSAQTGHINITGSILAANAVIAGISTDYIYADDFEAYSFNIYGGGTIGGDLGVGGNVVLGDASSDTITFSGRVNSDILPSTDNTYSLGSSSYRWADLYLGPGSLHIGTDGDEGVLSYNTALDQFEFGQTVAITGGTTGTALTVSNSTSTGDILNLQDNSTTVMTVADGGATTFQNAANSTAAFRVQTSAADNLLVVDTSTTSGSRQGIVSIGISNTSGTLLVLDTKTDSGDPSGVNGAMYYNSNLGKFRCYQNSSWVDCISAGASGLVDVVLSPEYAGATLTPDGTDNLGTLTSDFCSGTSRLTLTTSLCAATEEYNYYSWTSSETSGQQDYDIWVRYQLPADFSNFDDDSSLQFIGRRENSNDNVTVTTYRSVGTSTTACGSATGLSTTAAWETVTITGSETGCGFSGGDILLFKVTVSAADNRIVRVSNLELTYTK